MASDLFYFNLLEFYQISGTMNGKEIGHQSVTALHIFATTMPEPTIRGGRAQQQPAAQSYGASSASAHYYRSVVRSLGPVIVLR